ncbi:hypothetical protein BDW71DRAFT_176209 [Aspergillus fruticulosus]
MGDLLHVPMSSPTSTIYHFWQCLRLKPRLTWTAGQDWTVASYSPTQPPRWRQCHRIPCIPLSWTARSQQNSDKIRVII